MLYGKIWLMSFISNGHHLCLHLLHTNFSFFYSHHYHTTPQPYSSHYPQTYPLKLPSMEGTTCSLSTRSKSLWLCWWNDTQHLLLLLPKSSSPLESLGNSTNPPSAPYQSPLLEYSPSAPAASAQPVTSSQNSTPSSPATADSAMPVPPPRRHGMTTRS